MKRPDLNWRPPHVYLPGQSDRHDAALFAPFHAEIRPGLTSADLAGCRSWALGWDLMEAGYGWEAHEVLEPVWMALPEGSDERVFVQAVIQGANATLKARMDRPKAALRLCGMSRALVDTLGGPGKVILGRDSQRLIDWLDRVEGQLEGEL
ncbi:DUF309 domain-containing protein [Chachezhania sediminis]|uniref:DUF309 domain-containing protein n=1 Tax=Chachezhania sediminis TaxID=2599291 RepID=UPI001E359C03|nr:DUF309 domain-containing protein [Chachezhania sediminis]